MSGQDDFRRVGYPNGERHETPVDLAAVQSDDALLDILGSVGDTPVDTDDELTRVLAAWRREVRGAPVEELVDTDTALTVIRSARRPIRRRSPVFGSIAAAAAVLVIAFSGVGLFAKSAQPSDQLWGVAQVLYPDYARSVETAAAVRTELSVADKALKEGNTQKAKESLQRVQRQLPVIAEAEGRTDLTTLHRELEQKLIESPDTGSANRPSTSPAEGRIPGSRTPPSAEKPATSSEPTPNPTYEPDRSTKPFPHDPRSYCRGNNPPAGCPDTGSSTAPGGPYGGGSTDSPGSGQGSVGSDSDAPTPDGAPSSDAGGDSPARPDGFPDPDSPRGPGGIPSAERAPGEAEAPPGTGDYMPPMFHAVQPVAAG